MDAGSIGVDAREFLTVVAVAAAGLALAAVVAFTPWYASDSTDVSVIEVYRPATTSAEPAAQ